MEHSRRRCIYMTKYEYLLSKKESGELSILFLCGVPSQVIKQMEIYAYHLLHPDLSQIELAADLKTSQATVQR